MVWSLPSAGLSHQLSKRSNTRGNNMRGLCQTLMIAGALAFSAPAWSDTASETDPTGIWMLGKEKLTVKIRYCNGQNLCATIAGLRKPLDSQGNPKVDKNNPDPTLRSRPLMGLQVISNMKPVGDGSWKGQIYNADDGTTYRAEAKLNGDTFRVKGCWGPFCKKLNFKRVAPQASSL
jgi:uncharacterized protein (DUF2147 family)